MNNIGNYWCSIGTTCASARNNDIDKQHIYLDVIEYLMAKRDYTYNHE